MKLSIKIRTWALLLFGGVALSTNCANIDGAPAFIQGQWTRLNQMALTPIEQLSVFRMEDGLLQKLATCQLNDKKEFTFAVKPSEHGDFFYIGLDKLPQADRCIFFLKPGDQLDFTVNDSTYVLNGDDNSPENIAMTKWHDFIFPLEYKSLFMLRNFKSTFQDFNPQLDAMLSEIAAYPKANTPNKYFNREFEAFKRCNLMEIAMEYHFRPHAVHAEKAKDFGRYYRELSIPKLTTDAALFHYFGSMPMLDHALYIKHMLATDERPKNQDYMTAAIADIPNDTIKGELLLYVTRTKTTYDEVADLERQFGKYLLTPSQQERFMTSKNAKTQVGDHQPAPNFVGVDLDGKNIKLSDFVGKVVYIDVWATWCGPCLQEIPTLKKLEAEYTPKGVVFISLSVDNDKDKQKWRDMIAEKEMKGVQLFAGEKVSKEVYANYFITGIPRFIAIAKDGTVAEMTAPRPSSGEVVKKMLDKLLK